ncbi:MAG TPA: histidine phosphatase family protein [Terriglobia bacterium]|nr:histidine phosphatase family protein [Terriglobia bacterium]
MSMTPEGSTAVEDPERPADRRQKWMDHLVIVRHGESHRNVRRQAAHAAGHPEYGGDVRDVDTPLTRRGERQAEATGRFLSRQFRFDRIFVSPYLRTVETARLIMKQFADPVAPTYEERIREKEFGILDGLTHQGIAKKYPDELKRRQHEGKYYYRPPGGESYPDVALRLHSFLGTLARDCPKQSVLVVCHSVVVLTFRRLLERLTEQELLAIDRDPEHDVCNCSVTRYQFDPGAGKVGRLVLREFNGVHYTAELASTEECKRKAANPSAVSLGP